MNSIMPKRNNSINLIAPLFIGASALLSVLSYWLFSDLFGIFMMATAIVSALYLVYVIIDFASM